MVLRSATAEVRGRFPSGVVEDAFDNVFDEIVKKVLDPANVLHS